MYNNECGPKNMKISIYINNLCEGIQQQKKVKPDDRVNYFFENF